VAVKESSNNQWLAALRGPNRDEALADLRVLLMRGLRGALGGQANRADSSVEDFAQEALIKILGNLDSFRGECRFTTWAHKICVRTAFAEMRRSRWREVSLDEVMSQQPEESAAADPQLDPERAAMQTMIVEKSDLPRGVESLRHLSRGSQSRSVHDPASELRGTLLLDAR
jgi:RNA polymerase sigma-70 factor, ECF subfamily